MQRKRRLWWRWLECVCSRKGEAAKVGWRIARGEGDAQAPRARIYALLPRQWAHIWSSPSRSLPQPLHLRQRSESLGAVYVGFATQLGLWEVQCCFWQVAEQ